MKASLQDKVVVVTGAGSGIGRALAQQCVKRGARAVIGVDLLFRRSNNDVFHARTCDVTNAQHVQALIREIYQQFGRIDVYFSNAGIAIRPHKTEEDEPSHALSGHNLQDWNRIFQVNVLSHVIALKELLPRWKKDKSPKIFCLTASSAGLLTMMGDASYGVSKAAAVSLAEHVAIEHGNSDDHLRIFCLCPQAVDTNLMGSNLHARHKLALQAAAADGPLSADQVAAFTLDAIDSSQSPHSFWIFPHPKVVKYMKRRANDYDRWMRGMQTWHEQLTSSQRTSKL